VLRNELIIIVIIVKAVFIVWGVDQLRNRSSQHGFVSIVLLVRPWLWCCLLEFHRRFGLSLPWRDAWCFCKWLRGWGIHKCSKT